MSLPYAGTHEAIEPAYGKKEVRLSLRNRLARKEFRLGRPRIGLPGAIIHFPWGERSCDGHHDERESIAKRSSRSIQSLRRRGLAFARHPGAANPTRTITQVGDCIIGAFAQFSTGRDNEMSTTSTPGIDKTPNVCGGDACIRSSRIQVWLLVLKLKLGESDESILRSYPTLTADDLDSAWDYYREQPLEIERAIWLNDTAGNVPEGEHVPTSVIVDGKRLGLDDTTIREAFDPPLAENAVEMAWQEYRAGSDRLQRNGALTPRGR